MYDFSFRPVIIEVPHFGSLRGMEREIVILRSDNGETWREHTVEANDDTVQDVLNESFEGEGKILLNILIISQCLTVSHHHFRTIIFGRSLFWKNDPTINE